MMSVMAPKSILVIDDEGSMRELVRASLSDLANWNVATVASAQEGLKWLASGRPDVILLDVLMPGMNAITFLHRLRAQPTSSRIPVILLSVRARWFTPQQLQDLGIVKAIAKPFDPVTLPEIIAQALGWSFQVEEALVDPARLPKQ